MRAHTVLSVLRRCLNHWMPALAVALLLVLSGGTSWAQTAVPTGPDTQPSPAYLPPPDDPDPSAPYDDAAVVSISAPATMTTGGTAYVTVTMRNSGTTTWYPALATYPYRLGSQNPANNSTWGVGRVELGSTVAPGGQVVFGFTITAPTTAGTYGFSWGMLRENLAWFGAIASSTITVSAPAPVYDAQLVSAGVPAQMGVGGNYNVSLTFKNTGNVTWTQSDYRIGSSSPADNTTWGFARVDMGVASVAPGQSATFNFQVHAPATAGTYLFDWGMLYELHWRFGQTSGISVTVGGTNSSVTYIHTDGLGSPVARTDGAGNVINRTRYEPYGYVASGVQPTIGFTGHVNDVDTGLTYMQQRYYDPVAGRFLSIDPVVTNASSGESFNRYDYAANNPYNYIDPDGRDPKSIAIVAAAHKGEFGWGKPGWQGPLRFWPAFKCSIFVNEIIKAAGDEPPIVNGRPALAGELANKNLSIANWVVVTDGTVQDGDIVAEQEANDSTYTGHTGIIKYGGPGELTISANSGTGSITHNDRGFRKGQDPTFRRYIPGQGHPEDPSTKPKPKIQPPPEPRAGHE